MFSQSLPYLFWLSTLPALCAQTLTGHVRDSTGTPVEFASVMATDCRSKQVLAFSTTDGAGFFRLTFSTACDSVLLAVRSLGHQAFTRQVPVTSVQDFILSDAVLKEIIIKAQAPPIFARKDTTEYNVASFADSTEFSVEDILKKLPGIRVSENGRITLHGKEVERVLIEGDDLFSQNYTLATRNIRADMISKVQAIERFQENPLMQGIRESDRLVLNLKIKEDKKRSTSGSATPGLGYGNNWKAYAHTNLFSLTRRNKTYFIGNANNTGESALQGIQYLNQGDIFDKDRQGLQSNPLQYADLLRHPAAEDAGLPPAFTMRNRTGLLFIGHIMPFSESFKAKISGWAGREHLNQQGSAETRYLLSTGTLDVSEERAYGTQTDNWHIQVETDNFSADKKRSWRTFLLVDAAPQTSSLELTRTQTGAPAQAILQSIRKNAKGAFFSTEYTIRKSDHLLFQFSSKNAWHSDRQMLHATYPYYPTLFGLDSSYLHLQQNARIRQFVSAWAGKCVAVGKKTHWELESGVEWQTGAMKSAVSTDNDADRIEIKDTNFLNDFRLLEPIYYTRISGAGTWGNWYVRGRLGGFLNSVRQKKAAGSESVTHLWAIEPRLDVRHTFGEKTTLLLYYEFQPKKPFFSEYRPGFVFSDYQTTEKGLPGAVLMPTHSAGVRLVFNDRPNQFLWHIGAIVSNQSRVAGTQFDINPFLLLLEKYRPTILYNYSINAAASRYLPGISSRLAIDLGFAGQQYQGKVNDNQTRRFDMQTYRFRVEYGTAFDTWLNGNVSTQINRVAIKSTTSGEQITQTIVNGTTSAQLLFKPPGKFDAKFQIYRINIRSGREKQPGFYGIQGALRLRLPEWRSEVRVAGFNLLNTKQFKRIYADAIIQSTAVVDVVSPFVLLVWDYRF